MRQDTAPQLATRLRSYTIRWDTGPRAVYTCQQSRFLADWQHQQVNRTGTSAFPRCAEQLVAKAKRRAAAEVYTPGREKQRAAGRRGGEAHTIMRMRQCFPQEKWPTVHTAAQWRECWISATERFQRKPHKIFDLRCPLST